MTTVVRLQGTLAKSFITKPQSLYLVLPVFVGLLFVVACLEPVIYQKKFQVRQCLRTYLNVS
jgi:hypothetical protein